MFDNDADDYYSELEDWSDNECGKWCDESCEYCGGQDIEITYREPYADQLLWD